jgi:hypothetical protein
MRNTIDMAREAGFPLMSFEGVTYVSPELERLVALVRADEQARSATTQEPRCAMIVEVFGKDWRLDYMSLPVGKHKLYTQQYVYTTPPAAQRQHVTDGSPCWCEPETSYTDPETGASVIVHKEPQ